MGPKKASVIDLDVREPEANQALTSVDKAFFELEIQAINTKIERLQTLNEETEQQNAQLIEENKTTEEVRAETIFAAKSIMLQKSEDVKELIVKLEQLKTLAAEEAIFYQQQLFEMEGQITERRNELQANVKNVQGYLNSLEEFRIQRDELVKRYQDQTDEMERLEAEHKREIYSIEKKFIIGKDHLKREMIERLVTLSMEFQNFTDSRIAITNQRAVRENIALNNDLNMLDDTEHQLKEEIQNYMKRIKYFKNSMKINEGHKSEDMYKCKIQKDVVKEVNKYHSSIADKLKKYQVMEGNIAIKERLLDQTEVSALKIRSEVKILEQNLQNVRKENLYQRNTLAKTKEYTKYLLQTIMHITYKIQEDWIKPFEEFRQIGATGEEEPPLGEQQNKLFEFILNEIDIAFKVKMVNKSETSLVSFSDIYKAGDLLFDPKRVEARSGYPALRHAGVQVTIEDLQMQNVVADQVSDLEEEEVEEEIEEEILVCEEESQVFFSASTSELSSGSQTSIKDFSDFGMGDSGGEEEEDEDDDSQDLYQNEDVTPSTSFTETVTETETEN